MRRKPLFEEDYSDRYNTKLSPEDEERYQKWAKDNHRENDTWDYDMRGAWKAGVVQSENGHFPDTYKKPNHPTMSDESIYAKEGNHGRWVNENGKNVYITRKGLSDEEKSILIEYFKKVESDYQLRFPD